MSISQIKMKKIILGFAGQIASGKGTSSKYMTDRYEAKAYRFSTSLRDILHRLILPVSRTNLQDLAISLTNTFGQDVLSKVIYKEIQEDEHGIITIDGIRRLGDMEYFKKLPGFRLVYIDADMKLRFQRMKQNGENAYDISKTFDEFSKDHEKETETAIEGFKEKANYVVDNNGTLQELHKQLDEIIQKEIS